MTDAPTMAPEVSLYEHDVDVDGWVKELQQALAEKGFSPGQPDGWFGPDTRTAVEQFQAANAQDPYNLKVDGIVGNGTWAALRGRDPEPGGVDNPPHGDTRQHHGGGGGGEPAGPSVTFEGPPQYSQGTCTIGVQVTGTDNVTLNAYLTQGEQTVAQSGEVAVDANGPQTLSVEPNQSGTFELQVWATINGGSEYVVSETTSVHI
jgi:peptidoglycan hydrolase-like protein with peptidoglycan-binding domain